MNTWKILLALCAVTNLAVSEYKVVCFFTNWAWYRPDNEAYLPEDIDPDLCTHINYAFATLDSTELIMKPYDSWADIDNEFYSRVIAYKQYGIKVLITIGGWNDSAGDKYSRLVGDPAARANFNTNALAFCQQYGFDGIDLDWEYPTCWQNSCVGPPSDKAGFAAWVKELSELFHPEGLLVTADVSAIKETIDYAYDVPAISPYLDHINVMTFDYYGPSDRKTCYISPLYASPYGDPELNVNYSINYWISQGTDPQKLIMGLQSYGVSFTLADPNDNGINAPTIGGGTSINAPYYEICFKTEYLGWTVVEDPTGMGAYTYHGDQWISYDSISTVQIKSEYIQQMGLGGAMFYALDLDDFMGRCGEPYPLLKSINRVLRGYPTK